DTVSGASANSGARNGSISLERIRRRGDSGGRFLSNALGMLSQDQALPALSRSRTLDDAAWLWQFLKTELAPYPGRAWVVTRITIAATITMVLVMTFRVPYGFLAALAPFLLSRENPTATLRSFIGIVVVSAIATLYVIGGVMLLLDDPLTHFLWVATSA